MLEHIVQRLPGHVLPQRRKSIKREVPPAQGQWFVVGQAHALKKDYRPGLAILAALLSPDSLLLA